MRRPAVLLAAVLLGTAHAQTFITDIPDVFPILRVEDHQRRVVFEVRKNGTVYVRPGQERSARVFWRELRRLVRKDWRAHCR